MTLESAALRLFNDGQVPLHFENPVDAFGRTPDLGLSLHARFNYFRSFEERVGFDYLRFLLMDMYMYRIS